MIFIFFVFFFLLLLFFFYSSSFSPSSSSSFSSSSVSSLSSSSSLSLRFSSSSYSFSSIHPLFLPPLFLNLLLPRFPLNFHHLPLHLLLVLHLLLLLLFVSLFSFLLLPHPPLLILLTEVSPNNLKSPIFALPALRKAVTGSNSQPN